MKPLIYDSLNWAFHPNRDPNGEVRIEFFREHDFERYSRSLHAKGFLLNWLQRPSEKFLLSEAVYQAVDSSESLRAFYFRQFAQTPEGMGVLLMPMAGQYLYQIAEVPDQPGTKYIIVLWLAGEMFMSLEAGFITPAGIQMIDPECIYGMPDIDRAQTISYVTIFLNFRRGEPLFTAPRLVQGHAVEYLDLPPN